MWESSLPSRQRCSAGLAELAAMAVSVPGAVGAGAVQPLHSGPSVSHFLFLGSGKPHSPQPGSCGSGGPSLTSSNSHSECPVKGLSKAQPKPAARLLHSAGALCSLYLPSLWVAKGWGMGGTNALKQ